MGTSISESLHTRVVVGASVTGLKNRRYSPPLCFCTPRSGFGGWAA